MIDTAFKKDSFETFSLLPPTKKVYPNEINNT